MLRSICPTIVGLPLAALATAAPATAQFELNGRHLYSLEGDQFLGRFGWDVAAGDVNGDGFDDLVAGAPSEGGGGLARAYCGRTGLLLVEYLPQGAAGDFGEAIATLGDLNGDGAVEVAVGAPEAVDLQGLEFPGRVHVYDGASGALLAALAGADYFDAFGQSVAKVGDIDLDGVEDFVVGAPRPQTQGPFADGPGSVTVFSGATLTAFGTKFGTVDFDRYGDAVAGVGDTNGDGYPDIAVGAPGFDSGGFTGNGQVEILSGEWIAATVAGQTPATAQVLATVDGAFDIGALGSAVAGVGDTNGDGFPEVLAGAPNSDLNGPFRGVAELISGEWIAATAAGIAPLTPMVLDRFAGEDERDLFGRSVSALGDLDGDGFADFVIGASESFSPGPGPGYATIYSGATGDDFFSYRGNSSGDRVGWALDGGGVDFNGDGRPDLAMGADIGSGSTNGVGTAHALSGPELLLSADEHLASQSAGVVQTFFLDAPDANAGELYLLLGSLSGTEPGTPIPGSPLVLPLVADVYFTLSLNQSTGILGSALGNLDQGGEAFADLTIVAGALPLSTVGLTLHHAFLTIEFVGVPTVTSVSNAVPTTILP